MATQEMFNYYNALRQIHRRIFGVLEEYRRGHVDFKFSVRKQDTKDRLTYGLIFKGNDDYIEVGLSNESDSRNKTRTAFLKFDVAAGNVSSLSFNVAYSLNGEINAERMQLYRRLCERFQVPLQELENGTRIKGKIEIVRSPDDWEQPLRNWLDNNYEVMRNEFNDVLIDADEFLRLLRNQVERGVLSHDEHGYSINEDYAPAFDVVRRQPVRAVREEDDDDEDGDDDPTACETIKDLLLNNLQVILTGAPGTGKTFMARKVAEELVCEGIVAEEERANAKRNRIKSVQFHSGYDYSDFVIGMKPIPVGAEGNQQVTFDWRPGVFKEFVDAAKANLDHKYVFLIDEINRADLSRVFGEMFSLLEEDYRYYRDGGVERNVTGIQLPNGENFVIPKNLYIIGTMNDIDRSVESMDFALRRRFAWYEVTAEESESIIDEKVHEQESCVKLKRAMAALNSKIADQDFRLGPEYQLGGAIFAKYVKYIGEDDPFDNLWKRHIEIILKEYLRGRRTKGNDLNELQGIYEQSVRQPLQRPDPQQPEVPQPQV